MFSLMLCSCAEVYYPGVLKFIVDNASGLAVLKDRGILVVKREMERRERTNFVQLSLDVFY